MINSYEWLTKLVAFNTTSCYSNLSLIQAIQDGLVAQHIPFRLTYSPDREKANLFATLPAKNGSLEGGLLLSGHTDVVPVEGQKWNTDPFCATQINDRIYGRGTCDMKSFIAVILALIPRFQSLNLQKPLHLAFSYDEEVGCLGAPLLITDMIQQGIKPAACIVGEPTEMRPVIAHKGICGMRCSVHGLAAHSSLTPQGCNAIDYAAQLICWIRNLADQYRQQGPFDTHYDVPFTSISTNLISGGNAANIIPALCEFSFEFRHLSCVSPKKIIHSIQTYIDEELLPHMQKHYPQAAIELREMASVPSFEANQEAFITQLVRKLTQEKKIYKVAYATEAGLFQQSDIPTIVCGPGNIEQAHRENEFITMNQLQRCEDFLYCLVKQFLCE